MAQIINPNSFRLGTKLTWWSVSHYNIKNTNMSHIGYEIFHNDLLIRKYVEQIFKNFNIIVSEIIISRSPRLENSSDINKNKNLNSNYFNKIQNIKKFNNNNYFNKIQNINKNNSLSKKILFNNNKLQNKETLNLEFLVYFNSVEEKEIKIKNVSFFIKTILENILNKDTNLYNIRFNIKEVPNPTYNVNILGSWIGQELYNNARRHKAVIKKALSLIK